MFSVLNRLENEVGKGYVHQVNFEGGFEFYSPPEEIIAGNDLIPFSFSRVSGNGVPDKVGGRWWSFSLSFFIVCALEGFFANMLSFAAVS